MRLSPMLPAPLTAIAMAIGPFAATAQYTADPSTTVPESRPGAAASPATATAQRSPAVNPPRADAGPMPESEMREWERSHRATRIIGTDVRNLKGEKIGNVKDIVLDDRGAVAYVVVSTGGFLGSTDRLHAVPWQSLQTNASGKDFFVLDIDKARLLMAPGFTSKSWPNFNDARWNMENRKHYQDN